MDILKVQTENATAAQVFTFRNGKRANLEAVSMQEVWQLARAGRLEDMAGKEIANMNDIGLFSFLGFHSYYLIKPETI